MHPGLSFLSFLPDSITWDQFFPQTTYIQTFVSGSAFGESQAMMVDLYDKVVFQ